MSKVDHRDVQLRYREGGEEEIKNMIAEGTSTYVFKSAMKVFFEKNQVEGERFEYILRKYGVLSDNRGPARPAPGDKRIYSVQESRGTFFIRLPVSVLQVTPQELVEAEFRNDCIIIKNV